MIFFYIALFILAMFVIWLIYDKVSWHLAKYDEAKNGVVVIAEHMRFLRECLLNSTTPEKKELEEIFQAIQLNNARAAYILGGIKLLEKVSTVRPTPVRVTEEQSADIVGTISTTVSEKDIAQGKKAYNKRKKK